ncbi:MAG: hypothetical protein PVJ09_01720 [Candidatus Woesebacteria bacterium]|jgi:hypothetical protein
MEYSPKLDHLPFPIFPVPDVINLQTIHQLTALVGVLICSIIGLSLLLSRQQSESDRAHTLMTLSAAFGLLGIYLPILILLIEGLELIEKLRS